MNEQKTALLIVVFVVMLLFLVAALAIAFLLSKRQRLLHVVSLRQVALEHEQTLREAESKIVEATISNVARELHDNIGQLMTYVNLQVENKILDRPDLASELQPIQSALGDAREQLRSLGRTLSSDYIADQNIVRLIRMEIKRLEKVSSLVIHFEYDEVLPEITKEQTLMAFRIFQEFVSNTLKYAQATDFYVTLKGGNGFYLSLQDNGRGFDMDNIDDKNGIVNMQKRAELGKLELHIYSKPGNGTKTELLTKHK